MNFDMLLWPLLAATLVLLSHVPLGRVVLARGIVFLDLAIAQAGALATTLAAWAWQIEHPLALQAAALAGALLCALLLWQVEQHLPQQAEALIGVSFVLLSSVLLVVVSLYPHGFEKLQQALGGHIAWVDGRDVLLLAASSLPLALWCWLKPDSLHGWRFYALFALAVTSSLPVIGVYLVFASLVIPALASSTPSQGLVIGLIGYASGAVLSLVLDLPASPVMVGTLAVVAALTAMSNRLRERLKNRLFPGFLIKEWLRKR